MVLLPHRTDNLPSLTNHWVAKLQSAVSLEMSAIGTKRTWQRD